MEPLSLNIERIQIIIGKRENDSFRFQNPERSHAGFVLFTEGSGFYISDKGKREPIGCGSLILLRRGDRYGFYFDESCSYITSAFDFSDDSDAALSILPRIALASESTMALAESAEKIWKRRRFDSEMLSRAKLLELYCELLREHIESDDSEHPAVTLALEYIHNNFKTNFSSREIADFCSVSPSHLRALFAERIGSGITDYRNELRISTAKEMLKSRIFSIKEIAEELGFCDVYYFSKCFSRIVGKSPSRYAQDEA